MLRGLIWQHFQIKCYENLIKIFVFEGAEEPWLHQPGSRGQLGVAQLRGSFYVLQEVHGSVCSGWTSESFSDFSTFQMNDNGFYFNLYNILSKKIVLRTYQMELLLKLDFTFMLFEQTIPENFK